MQICIIFLYFHESNPWWYKSLENDFSLVGNKAVLTFITVDTKNSSDVASDNIFLISDKWGIKTFLILRDCYSDHFWCSITK